MDTVLIVDDDELFRDALRKNLQHAGFDTLVAENGKRALHVLKMNSVDLILSDIRMPEMDGIELVKAVREKSSVPFILMTGFSDIVETKTAHDLGANDFVAKPFKAEEIVAAIRNCLHSRSSDAITDESLYCKLSIQDFITGRTIRFNIFLRLGKQKFIRLAHKGEDISMDRIHYYREKGVHHLYLRREDFRQYVGFSLTLTQAANNTKIVDPEKKLNLLRHTGEILNEQIRCEGVDEQAYESAESFVEVTIDILSDNHKALDVLDTLRKHADHILIHSVGVSLYSVMLAQSLEWSLPTNKFKIAMGGLLHDIGMKELNEQFANRPRYTWSPNEVREYESHPLRGISILDEIEGVSNDVREIVKQHHENCLSRGFPLGTKKMSIHPMAKLISVADEFCYRTLKGPQTNDVTPADAIKDMQETCAQLLDRAFLDTLARLFGVRTQRYSTQIG